MFECLFNRSIEPKSPGRALPWLESLRNSRKPLTQLALSAVQSIPSTG